MIHNILGVSVKLDPRGDLPEAGIGRFLMPVSECEFQLNSILDDLEPDPWHVLNDERNARCTGTALNLAVSLLEAVPKMGSRIMTLLGGPCTIGPGTVVGVKLKEMIRSHHDITNNTKNCNYMKKAL